MALSEDQRRDMRRDLGLADDGGVFTDTELDRLFTRAGDDYALAVYLAFRQLLANAAKLNDYRLGSSSESKSQVFKHVQGMMEVWGKEAGVDTMPALQTGVIALDFVEKSGDR